MVATVTVMDAAFLPSVMPEAAGFAFYLPGGDQFHAWPASDIKRARKKYTYALPVFVQANLSGSNGSADGHTAATLAEAAGFTDGGLALDIETAVSPAYVVAFQRVVEDLGYTMILYGSESTVFHNPAELYWTGHFGVTSLDAGAIATQFKTTDTYDMSWFETDVAKRLLYPKGIVQTPPESEEDVLVAPSSLSDTPYSTVTDFSWGPVEQYHFQVQDAATGKLVADVTQVDTHAQVRGLAANTAYKWRVSMTPHGEWTAWKAFSTNENADPA